MKTFNQSFKYSLSLLSLLAILAVSINAQAEVPVYQYQVINKYPHNPYDFTQGLAFHQGYLYEGTGRRGQSLLKKSRLEDGEILMRHALGDRYFGEGIEIVGNRIYQLTWQSHIVFAYDVNTFEQVDTYYNATEGWGLTFDGDELVMSDGTDNLYFIDPETFVPTRKIAVTMDGVAVRQLNELEFINDEIWANVFQTDFIVRIDPETGIVNSLVNLSGLSSQTVRLESGSVLNGIAFDRENERLFVTGKLWSDIFEIQLLGPN